MKFEHFSRHRGPLCIHSLPPCSLPFFPLHTVDHCGRQTSQMVPKVPISCEYDETVSFDYFPENSLLAKWRERFSCWSWRSTLLCGGEDHMAEYGRGPLGAESSCQLTAGRKTWPSVLQGKELNSANNQWAQKGPPGLRWLGHPSTPLISTWAKGQANLSHETDPWKALDDRDCRFKGLSLWEAVQQEQSNVVNDYLCPHPPPFPLVPLHSVCPQPRFSHHLFHLPRIVIPSCVEENYSLILKSCSRYGPCLFGLFLSITASYSVFIFC